WARKYTAAELDAILNDMGVICGPIYSIADIFADKHFWARDALLTHHDPEIGDFVGPGVFPKFSATPSEVKWTGPRDMGAHNAQVYGELLGFDSNDLARLSNAGII